MANGKLQRMIRIAVLGALAFLMMLWEVHVPGFAEFLKYDPGDIPALLATYTMGPVAGLGVQVIKAGLFWVSGKSQAGWVGVLANFMIGAALVITTGILHTLLTRMERKAWAWGLLSAVLGTVLMTALVVPPLAVIIYPFWGMKGAAAWQFALNVSTPFNLFKGMVSSLVSVALYRRLQPVLAPQSARNVA